tara:strand:- start:16 stop:201 length:186 start_codon:yes stop_codon:yes gene_type:complete
VYLFNECLHTAVAVFDTHHVVLVGEVAVVRIFMIQQLDIDGIVVDVVDGPVVDILDFEFIG